MSPQSEQEIAFGPFRLDCANARLLHGARPVPLTPKAFDVLSFLAQRPDRLVTKEELLSAIWPDVIVSDASVKVCVREVRKALDDDPQSPRFIETVHRRGYRFIAAVGAPGEPPAADAVSPGVSLNTPSPAQQLPASHSSRHTLVGRNAELRQMEQCLGRAIGGERQIVFVIGTAGSGKTSLVEGFVRQLRAVSASPRAPLVAVGHCFEQYGASEPYLPVWEALSRLARERDFPALTSLLERHAASDSPVLAHRPEPSQPDDSRVGPRLLATEPRQASERMLRDITGVIESLAADLPVVLVLEDLHWADYSTLDLVSALARRGTQARLMVIGTYRPGEVPAREQPLRAISNDLQARRLCCELNLEPLDEPAVSHYLNARFPGQPLPESLPQRLHQRTGGHPLFLASVVDDLDERDLLNAEESRWASALEDEVPSDVRAVIESQLDRLSPAEQRLLDAAAVAGVEFSAAAVAGALAGDPGEPDEETVTVVSVENSCEGLARRQRFLEAEGVDDWPDGTVATRYRFLHQLYHDVVAERVPAARRARMHRALGLRLESAWAVKPAENAADLAFHFEQGREFPKAIRYLRDAAERATRQYAHREAVDYLRRAVAALDRLSELDRGAVELPLLKSLAVHLQVTQGFAAPEVHQVQARARALCQGIADTRITFPVLWGIWLSHKVRSELNEARRLAEQLLTMARESGDAAMILQAHQALSVTSLCLGDPARTVEQMQHTEALYDPGRHGDNTQIYGQDPRVATLAFGAVALCLMGRDPEAQHASERALELARSLSQPSSLALALHFSAMLAQCRGDADAVEQQSQAGIDLASWEGFSFWHAGGQVLHGWALAIAASSRDRAEPGLDEIRQGINAWLATGSRTYHTYHLGLLADALLRHRQPAQALAHLDEAIAAADTMPEGIYEAELHRLKGRCLLAIAKAGAPSPQVRDCFERALEIAETQGAKAFAQRAQADLASLSAH